MMKYKDISLRITIASLASGVCWASVLGAAPALAQAAAAPVQATASSPDADGRGLGDIVVTARRRDESLQKVPVAVSVLTSSALARENVSSPQDLNALVPSLGIASSGTARDAAVYSIRGQGQTFGGSDPAVVTYFAEVPTDGTAPGLLFDLQSVQVLKGPQGTLFGRNTTGGAVLLQPTRPGDQLGGYIDVSGGDYSLRRVQGAVDVPITPGVIDARFAVDLNKRRGFTRDAISGARYDSRNYQSYRGSLIIRPFDGFENYSIFGYTHSNSSQAGTSISNLDPNGLLATVFPSLIPYFAQQQARGVRVTESDIPNGGGQLIKHLTITNISTYRINDSLTIKNVFGYRDLRLKLSTDSDGTSLPLINVFPNGGAYSSGLISVPSSRVLTDELQLQGTAFSGGLNYLLGGYIENRRPANSSNSDLETIFFSTTYTQSLKRDNSKAIFAQGTYALTSSLKLTAGARYTWDKRSQTYSSYVLATGPLLGCGIVNAPPSCVVRDSASFRALSGNVSLDWQVTPHSLVYVASRRGYKSGGFNSSAPDANDRIFDPEYVTDLEVGAKNQFSVGDVAFRINADFYRSWFRDLQENGTISAPQGLFTITRNAGRGYVQGIELESVIRPVTWLTLSGYYSYTDPKYTENLIAGVDLRNSPFFSVAKNKFSFTAEGNFNLGAGVGKLVPSATYSYQSRSYFGEGFSAPITNPRAGQAAYGTLNLRASLNNVGGSPFDLSVFVTNATNKKYKIAEFDAYQLLGASFAVYGEPRMWGVDLRVRFGGGS